MSWALLLFLLPLVLFTVIVLRVIRASQQFRNPEHRRSFLSGRVKAVLLEAGIDPNSLTKEDIKESEEVRNLIAADLRRVLFSVIFGRFSPEPGVSPDAAQLRMDHGSNVPMRLWRPPVSTQGDQPFVPPPIDQPSGSAIRAVLVLAIIASTAVAIYVVNFHP